MVKRGIKGREIERGGEEGEREEERREKSGKQMSLPFHGVTRVGINDSLDLG